MTKLPQKFVLSTPKADRRFLHRQPGVNGLGELGKISVITEGVEIRPFDVLLELSGIPPADLADAMNEDVQGRSCIIWEAWLDAAEAVIANPIVVFQGRLDTMDVKLGATGTIQVRAVSLLEDWERRSIGRYTDKDQKEEYPGDRGLEFLAERFDREITWGATPPS